MKIHAADLFCGAGGSSTGLAQACSRNNADLQLIAINHWDVAIDTHTANHPSAKHLCESLDSVDPRKMVPEGRLNLLVASPECTHHSVARGGRPMSDQSRASAFHVLRWLEALYVENVLIENVPEFQSWGPLDASGRPLKSKRGALFYTFIESMKAMGYRVEWRVLNSADYGDPTTRRRLFILARRGNRKIVWPEPTHSRTGERTLFGAVEKWRPAREIIDWDIEGTSIFNRKRPLAPKTLARIAAGLHKFGGAAAEPFLVILRNHQDAQSVDQPLPTITAGGGHAGLVEPFLVGTGGPSGSAKPKSIDDPLNTVLKENRYGLCEPFVMSAGGPEVNPRSASEPIPTVLTRDRLGLVEPFLMKVNHGYDGSKDGGNGRRVRSLDEPMQTITTQQGTALVEPLLVEYYGTGKARRVSEPVPTVTSKDRFALIETQNGTLQLDIRFRMLQPHELSAAMGFPKDYEFTGNRADKVRQIGNAVPVNTAAALCAALLELA